MKETKKRPGSKRELKARQKLRQQQLLNAPLRGIRSLAKLAAELRRRWLGRDHPPDWVLTRHGWRPPYRTLF